MRVKLDKLKLALTLPAPQDAEKTAKLSQLVAELGVFMVKVNTVKKMVTV